MSSFTSEMKSIIVFLIIFCCHYLCFVLSEDITFDTSVLHAVTNENFVGVAIDSGVVRRHWQKFHPNSKKVIALARGLSPSYLRVGGTDADFLIFSNDGSQCKGATKYRWLDSFSTNNIELNPDHVTNRADQDTLKFEPFSSNSDNHSGRMKRDVGYELKKDLTNFTMTASFYDQIHSFVSTVGWELIFDLNSLLRVNRIWDSTNAEKLVNYTASCGYKMAGWELGNEPNAYYRLIKFRLDPAQLASDYKELKRVLSNYPEFSETQVLGPSTTQLNKRHTEQFFESFLTSGGGDVVTAATFHQYYVDGKITTKPQFYDPDVLNVLYDEIHAGMNITQASGSRAKVWLGETSSAWGGGAVGLSDRYIAGFMWLDKLGMAARDGISALIRQSFYGGHYSLIDSTTLNPNPDYWLTLLYKMLVSNKVLHVTSTDSSGTLRVYAHCTDTKKSGYTAGSVTVIVINLSPSDVNITLPEFLSSTLHVYNLTPTGQDLLSQFVDLNGVTLQMKDEKTLPNIQIPIKTSGTVPILGQTFSFIVIPDAKVNICSV